MNPPLSLAWRDALAAVLPGTFSQAEAAAGWPQALTPEQLARLQRPYTSHKDRTAYRACQALEQTIAEAVASGDLSHTVKQHSTPERWEGVTNAPNPFAAYSGDQGFASREWLDRDFRSEVTIRRHIPAQNWQTHQIAPADARAWMAAQGEAPSKHVAAWFAGAGLQPADVGAPVQPHAIVPPHAWELHSPHGFLGSDAGKLVRLADVVAWLMTTREMPIAEAVETVAVAIEGAGIDGLHCIDPERRARHMAEPSDWDELLLPAEDRALGMSTAKARELAAMIRSSWLRDSTERLNPEDYPPFDPARIAPGDPATRWAVTHEKAHALWGWGEVRRLSVPVIEPAQITTYAELAQFRNANKAAPWTDGMKAVLTAEEHRRNEIPGARGVRKAMGKELGGISDKRIGQLIRGYQETQRQRPATPLRAVGAG